MAMVKCSECGKDISDKAAMCIGCGAPTTTSLSLGALGTAAKSGIDDVKDVLFKLKGKVIAGAEAATEHGKELIKSQQQKDAEDLERLEDEFGKAKPISESKSEHDCARFKAALESTIDLKFAEVMRGKTDADRFLAYVDGQVLTGSVRNVFKCALGVTPPQVEAACSLSEAILAPSSEERERLVKTAVGVSGGAAGIGMVIAGVGGALGWGAGVIASISAFFVGTSIAGPLGWTIAGVTLAAVAAYFATTSDKHTDTERFLRVLKSSSGRAVAAIWPQHEAALVKVLDRESAA